MRQLMIYNKSQGKTAGFTFETFGEFERAMMEHQLSLVLAAFDPNTHPPGGAAPIEITVQVNPY